MADLTMTPPAKTTVRRLAAVIALLLAALALVLAVQIGPIWYSTPDAVGYLSIARSFVRDGFPTNRGDEHLYLAVGYPLLICPVFMLAERPFLLLSILQFAWAVAFMLGVYSWAKRRVPAAALWITALTIVNVSLWNLYRRPVTEITFMTLLIWVVNVANGLFTPAAGRRTAVRVALLAFLIALLAMVRPVGIMTAPGIALLAALAVWERRVTWVRAASCTLAAGLPATLILAGLVSHDRLKASQTGGNSYVNQLVDRDVCLADQLIEGARLRIQEAGRLLIPGMYKCYDRRGSWVNPNMALYLPLGALIATGWLVMVRGIPDLLVLVLPWYVLLYVVWPYDQGTRFFTPLLPLWFACIWVALAPLAAYRGRSFGILLGLHFAVAAGYWLFNELPNARETNRQWENARTLSEPLRACWQPTYVSRQSGDIQFLLEYELDRPLRGARYGASIGPDVGWLVLTADEKIDQGFTLYSRAGPFCLYRRVSRDESPSETSGGGTSASTPR